MIVVTSLQAGNRATEANIAPLLIKNRKDRLRVKRASQKLQNTLEKKVKNLIANKSFQVSRNRFQGNRVRGEKRTIRKASLGSSVCGTRRNPSVFPVKNMIVALLYVEIKNPSYILVGSKWDESDNNIEVGS